MSVMFSKLKYKKYCEGKVAIQVIINPDYYARVPHPEVRQIGFGSGRVYLCRLVKAEKLNSRIDRGIYHMTDDIQKLSYIQFCKLLPGRRIVRIRKH